MNKQSARQKSFFHNNFFSKKVLFCLFIILFVLVVALIIFTSQSSKDLDKAYSQLSIPKNWQLTSVQKIPGKSLLGCAAYPDLACPANDYSYLLPINNSKQETINYIKGRLSFMNFTFDENCNSDNCSNTYVVAHKGHVVVRASVQESGQRDVLYLHLEKS